MMMVPIRNGIFAQFPTSGHWNFSLEEIRMLPTVLLPDCYMAGFVSVSSPRATLATLGDITQQATWDSIFRLQVPLAWGLFPQHSLACESRYTSTGDNAAASSFCGNQSLLGLTHRGSVACSCWCLCSAYLDTNFDFFCLLAKQYPKLLPPRHWSSRTCHSVEMKLVSLGADHHPAFHNRKSGRWNWVER